MGTTGVAICKGYYKVVICYPQRVDWALVREPSFSYEKKESTVFNLSLGYGNLNLL